MIRAVPAVALTIALLPFGAEARARTEPIKDPVQIPLSAKASVTQVRTAAQVAAQSRGWTVDKRSGNTFEAVYAQEGRRSSFSARISVSADAKSVTIKYVSSEGLDYGDGAINANYNKWMGYLAKDIPIFLDWIVAAQ